MAMGLVGQKTGMTRIFTEDGASVPVTVIKVSANKITQRKSQEVDGYRAVQVTTGTRRASRVTKPMAGHLSKAGVEAGRGLWEFRLDADDEIQGSELKLEMFQVGQKVDVQGTTQGKGFAGVIKRHNFSHQDYTHGNSISHRAPGSIGQCQTPGRVFKGKKMTGHMGAVKRTQQNLEVIRVDVERGLLLVKGAVPGSKGGNLIITSAVKQVNKG